MYMQPAQSPYSYTGLPPIIQTNNNSNTSALGTADQTIRQLMEERNKHDRDKAALQNKHAAETAALHNRIKALERLANSSQLTGPTLSSTAYTTNTRDNRICKSDASGNKWFQVAYYCSKHGFNISHNNPHCNKKQSPGKYTWIEGATASETKGGNPKKGYAVTPL